MNSRQTGDPQETAAAKAGISVRSGRRIENNERRERRERDWRTRQDPFADIWASELTPMLEAAFSMRKWRSGFEKAACKLSG